MLVQAVVLYFLVLRLPTRLKPDCEPTVVLTALPAHTLFAATLEQAGAANQQLHLLVKM